MADEKEVVEDGKEEVKDEVVEVKLSEDEQRAVNLGWKPKDKWEGDATDWVPAKWWLKYGDVEQKVITLEHQDKQKDKVITAMKNHYVRVKEDSVREVLDTIKRQKRDAIKNEDFEEVAKLDVQAEMLQDGLNRRFQETDKQVVQDNAPVGPPPEFQAWNRENSWYKYGNTTDPMTAEADTLAIGYMTKNPNAPYPEMLRYVEDKIKKIYSDKFKPADEVIVTGVDEGGNNNQPAVGSKGKYKLSEAEKAAAKEFGIPEADYAKQLQEFDKRKGF